MGNNDDFILDMLREAQNNSTDISNDSASDNLEFKRDEHGNLCSYNKETGEKVGQIYEHGNNKGNVAKTFGDLI